MRYALCLLLLGVLVVVSACGGDEAPTAVPTVENQVPPTAEPIAQPTNADGAVDAPPIEDQLNSDPNAVAQGVPGRDETELEVPLPGTLVASATEDPDIALIFDRITLIQTGGPNNIENRVEVLQSGMVTRNGQATTISQEEVAAIDTMLDELNFFGLQATFIGPAAAESVYRYSITVARGASERTINAQEGFIPPEFQRFMGRLMSLGQPSGPSG